jgi:hypothetical protein
MTPVSVPRVCAYVCAAILASSVSYGLLRMPLQVHDSLDKIIAAQQSPGVWALFTPTGHAGTEARSKDMKFPPCLRVSVAMWK